MLSSPAVFLVSPASSATSPPADLDAEFLDDVGPCTGSRVLVLGNRRAGLMCGLIRRGCLAVTSLQQGSKPQAGAFDAVLVPHVTSGDDLDGIVASIWQALAPAGGFVACLTDGTSGGAPGLELERRLRLHGFGSLRTRRLGGSLLLQATLSPSRMATHHG